MHRSIVNRFFHRRNGTGRSAITNNNWSVDVSPKERQLELAYENSKVQDGCKDMVATWQPQINPSPLHCPAPARGREAKSCKPNELRHIKPSLLIMANQIVQQIFSVANCVASRPPPSSSVVRLPFHEFAANNGCAAKVTFSCHDARHRTSEHQSKGSTERCGWQ